MCEKIWQNRETCTGKEPQIVVTDKPSLYFYFYRKDSLTDKNEEMVRRLLEV